MNGHTDIAIGASQRTAMRWKEYVGIILFTMVLAIVLKLFVVEAIYVPSPSMEPTLLNGDFMLVNKIMYGGKNQFFRLPAIKTVERGDIIVFEFPSTDYEASHTAATYFVKRCVAVGGDRVDIRDGILSVNGNKVDVLHSSDGKTGNDQAINNYGQVVVPKKGDVIPLNGTNFTAWETLIQNEGHRMEVTPAGILIDGVTATSYTIEKDYLFVLGDNRDHSYDSRYWGFLPYDRLVGKAMFVYWSIDPKGKVRWDRIGTLTN